MPNKVLIVSCPFCRCNLITNEVENIQKCANPNCNYSRQLTDRVLTDAAEEMAIKGLSADNQEVWLG
jgi:hypothetical protein